MNLTVEEYQTMSEKMEEKALQYGLEALLAGRS